MRPEVRTNGFCKISRFTKRQKITEETALKYDSFVKQVGDLDIQVTVDQTLRLEIRDKTGSANRRSAVLPVFEGRDNS